MNQHKQHKSKTTAIAPAKVPQSTDLGQARIPAQASSRGSKGAQIAKRQIESKKMHELAAGSRQGHEEIQTGRAHPSVHQPTTQAPTQQLNSVRSARLNKQQYASSRHLYEESDDYDMIAAQGRPRNVSSGQELASDSSYSRFGPNYSTNYEDSSTTVKKSRGPGGQSHPEGANKQKVGSLKSTRMRHLQGQAYHHQLLTSSEHPVATQESQLESQPSEERRHSQKATLKRIPGFSKIITLSKQRGGGAAMEAGQPPQISSARNRNFKQGLGFQDTRTPALIAGPAGGQAFQSASSQQLAFDLLNATKVVGGHNHRYRSQQVSKIRQRPPAPSKDTLVSHSVSSGGEETVRSGNAMQPQTHQTTQGRLLFKRQEKYASNPSNAFGQHPLGSARNHQMGGMGLGPSTLPSKDFGFHPSTSSTNKSQVEGKQHLSCSTDQNSSSGSRLKNQSLKNLSKAFMGENKRESAFRSSHQQPAHLLQGTAGIPVESPRSDQAQRFRNARKGVSQHSLASFEGQKGEVDGKHLQYSYQSVQEFRATKNTDIQAFQNATPGTVSSQKKTTRSLRRLAQPEQPGTGTFGETNQGESSDNNASSADGLTYSSKFNNSKQTLRHIHQPGLSQPLMNIREESSAHKQGEESRPESLLLQTRGSIPNLSTKHFLESGELKREPQTLQKSTHDGKTDFQVPNRAHQKSKQPYEENSSFDKRPQGNAKLGQGRHGRHLVHHSGSLHQHSSSVLPSHRQRHLISSVNVLQPGANSAASSRLQQYSNEPRDELPQQHESHLHSHREAIYNSATEVPEQHSASQPGASPHDSASQHQVGPVPTSSRYTKGYTHQASQKNLSVQMKPSGAHQQLSHRHSMAPQQNDFSEEGPHQAGKVLVNKVQMKNQQFKFQLRRKTQQSSNYSKLKQSAASTGQRQTTNQQPPGLSAEKQTEAFQRKHTVQEQIQNPNGQVAAQSYRGTHSQRPTVYSKPQPEFVKGSIEGAQQLTDEELVSALLERDSFSRKKSVPTGGQANLSSRRLNHGVSGQSSRNQKLLSSQSPPKTDKIGMLLQAKHYKDSRAQDKKKSLKHPPRNQTYQPSPADFSEAGSSECKINMASQVKGSRQRLLSVAEQSQNALLKKRRLSDANEKAGVSSQNSGGNISGLTQIKPQKPPSTPLKPVMQPSFSGVHQQAATCENDTTQKASKRISATNEILKTKKRAAHADTQISSEARGSEKLQSSSRTQKRMMQIQKSSGATSNSQEESEYLPSQSLPSIRNKKGEHTKPSGKISRNGILKSEQGKKPVQEASNVVTSYNQQVPQRVTMSSKLSEDEQPYIVSSALGGVSQVNPVGSSNYSQTKTFDSQCQDASSSIYQTRDESVTLLPNSTHHATDSEAKIFQRSDASLQSAYQVMVQNRDHEAAQFAEGGSGKLLLKTSSVNQINHYQNHLLVTQNQSSQQSSQPQFNMAVYSNQQSAAEIERLHEQIKERELAYSSLKSQFEQLRKQVAKKQRNTSTDSAPIRFQARAPDHDQIVSGKASFIETSHGDDSTSRGHDSRMLQPAVESQWQNFQAVRESLQQLNLMKQRSNSEAHIHQHFMVPLRSVNEQTRNAGHPLESKSAQRTPFDHQDSKLKQPTRFARETVYQDASQRGVSGVKLNTSSASSVTSQGNNQHPAGVSHMLKKKTTYYHSQLNSQSPVKSTTSFTSKRQGLLAQAQHGNQSERLIRNPSSNTKSVGRIRVPAKGLNSSDSKGNLRGKATGVNIKGQSPVRKHGSSQTKSAQCLDQSPQKQQPKPQNQSSPTIKRMTKPKQPSGPLKTHSGKVVIQRQSRGAAKEESVEQKLAIENLKQAINSTGKKLINQKRKRGSLSISSSMRQVEIQRATIQEAHQKDLTVLEEEQVDDQPLHSLPKESFVTDDDGSVLQAEATEDRQQEQQSSNKYVSSALVIQKVESLTEPLQESIARQESYYKEETPSNEQSQSSITHPKPHVEPPMIRQIEESKSFRATGTAFGLNNEGQPSRLVLSVAPQANIIDAQAPINCFGQIPVAGEQRYSEMHLVEEQTSAVFARPSEMSQKSATFANQFNASIKQPSPQQVSASETIESSRCETPIHPNQIVDGIKFMDVQDPAYMPSNVFEQVHDGYDNFVQQNDSESLPAQPIRKATPMVAMNSTGKEFFANQKRQIQAATEPSNHYQDLPLGKNVSTSINQHSTIQILKQLQKKKQINNANQRKLGAGQHPKVAVSSNNPFFVKQSKNGSINAGSSGGGAQLQSLASASNTSQFNRLTNSTAGFLQKNQADGVSRQQVALGAKSSINSLVKLEQQESLLSPVFVPQESIGASGLRQQQPSAFNHQSKGLALTQEQSMVSHEIFYSPIQPGDGDDQVEEEKDSAVEILPQYSQRQKQSHTRRASDVAGGANPLHSRGTEGDHSSFQVSHIEHVKRDDILDDSLLFALQEHEPKRVANHLQDEEQLANAHDLNANDFFSQPTSQQHSVIMNSDNLFADLAPTTKKEAMGDGLILDSHKLSSDMAALENKIEASPGLMKKHLDSNQGTNPNTVRKFALADHQMHPIGGSLTDQKELVKTPNEQPNEVLSNRVASKRMLFPPEGHRSGAMQINSGSKYAMTDMMLQSNANLTYSDDESSPGKGERAAIAVSISEWTGLQSGSPGPSQGYTRPLNQYKSQK